MNKTFYNVIKTILMDARNKVYQTTNLRHTGRSENPSLRSKVGRKRLSMAQDC